MTEHRKTPKTAKELAEDIRFELEHQWPGYTIDPAVWTWVHRDDGGKRRKASFNIYDLDARTTYAVDVNIEEDFVEEGDDEEEEEEREPEPDLSGNWMKDVLDGETSRDGQEAD